MAGFNRRFAPLSIAAREYFRDHAGPLAVSCRVNAGYLPPDHWTQDPDVGGGRIIGEACHFVDLLSFLTDSIPVRVLADSASAAGAHSTGDDICSLVLRFENGSIGSISYFANGDKVFPKERVEIFGGGAVFVVDDFRATSGARSGKSWSRKHKGQDKGHKAALEAFFTAVRDGGMPPIPYDSQFATTRATFAAVNCLRSGTDAGSRL